MSTHSVDDVAMTALQLNVAIIKHLESRNLINNEEYRAILKTMVEANTAEGKLGVVNVLASMINNPPGARS